MNKLYLSEEAQIDLAEIKAYISEKLENPSAALNTIRHITKSLRILQTHAKQERHFQLLPISKAITVLL